MAETEPRKYTSAELRSFLPWWLRHACPLYVTPLILATPILWMHEYRALAVVAGVLAGVAAFAFDWWIRGWLIRHGYWGPRTP